MGQCVSKEENEINATRTNMTTSTSSSALEREEVRDRFFTTTTSTAIAAANELTSEYARLQLIKKERLKERTLSEHEKLETIADQLIKIDREKKDLEIQKKQMRDAQKSLSRAKIGGERTQQTTMKKKNEDDELTSESASDYTVFVQQSSPEPMKNLGTPVHIATNERRNHDNDNDKETVMIAPGKSKLGGIES